MVEWLNDVCNFGDGKRRRLLCMICKASFISSLNIFHILGRQDNNWAGIRSKKNSAEKINAVFCLQFVFHLLLTIIWLNNTCHFEKFLLDNQFQVCPFLMFSGQLCKLKIKLIVIIKLIEQKKNKKAYLKN